MSKRKVNSLIKLAKTIYIILIIVVGVWQLNRTTASVNPDSLPPAGSSPAAQVLQQLAVKGRAPKTGYSRSNFSDGWANIGSCDLRNYILSRDMTNIQFVIGSCKVSSGQLNDPYTGKQINFVRGSDTSDAVQIDHVVALGDAWQKGAQNISALQRYALANDPLNLLAVDGPTNQNKGDSDAASWLPPNKNYRCNYVARQISVKHKYNLWVTPAEYQAMAKILVNCPDQTLPLASVSLPLLQMAPVQPIAYRPNLPGLTIESLDRRY